MIRKKIYGFSNYEISKCGKVFSTKRKHNQSNKYDEKEIEMKIQFVENAYAILGLVDDNGNNRMKSVHRLIAEAFIPNPENKRTVNHKDGDKHNNTYSNLEWATYQENSQHSCDTGLNPKQKGDSNGMSKISEEECIQLIIEMLEGANNNELAKKYKLHSRYISLIRGKKRWKHLWENTFKNKSPDVSYTRSDKELDIDTQIIIINRIKNGEMLKSLSIEYSIDPSTLSRVKNNKTWNYAYKILNKRNAQRLSKAPLKQWEASRVDSSESKREDS